MFNASELIILRRAFARQVMFHGSSSSLALENAFATVEREKYVGPGPWSIFRWPRGYTLTPDADPAWLYADVLIGLQPERGLNNGQPSGHAKWITAVDPKPGEHIVHVGAGVGYYSAIMAELVGKTGAVTAIEYDTDLARQATDNLSQLPNVRVIQGDGSKTAFNSADIIYVNAGASRPADVWLDRLKENGRLLLPLTTNKNFKGQNFSGISGAAFLIVRHGNDFEASFVSPIGIIPGEGMRDEESERALVEAFEKQGYREVKKLLRTDNVPVESCWVRAPGWSLTYA